VHLVSRTITISYRSSVIQLVFNIIINSSLVIFSLCVYVRDRRCCDYDSSVDVIIIIIIIIVIIIKKLIFFFPEKKSFSSLYRRRREDADRVPRTRPQTVASRHDISAAMSALTAGVQYSLSSNQNNGLMPKQRTGKNKTLFFVKLTDSCLKAVEDYLRCCQQVRSFYQERDLGAKLIAIYATIFSLGDRLFSLILGPLCPLGRRLRDFSCARPARLVSLWPRPHIHSLLRFFGPGHQLAPLVLST